MAKLKVFQGNFDGDNYRLVATTSKVKASEMLGIKMKFFDRYVSLVNEKRVEYSIAMAKPGTVFTSPILIEPNTTREWIDLRQVQVNCIGTPVERAEQRWDSQADKFNPWCNLDMDEKVALVDAEPLLVGDHAFSLKSGNRVSLTEDCDEDWVVVRVSGVSAGKELMIPKRATRWCLPGGEAEALGGDNEDEEYLEGGFEWGGRYRGYRA